MNSSQSTQNKTWTCCITTVRLSLSSQKAQRVTTGMHRLYTAMHRNAQQRCHAPPRHTWASKMEKAKIQLAMMPALMTRALSLTGLFFSRLGSSLGYFSTSLGSSSGKATKPPKGIALSAYSTSLPCSQTIDCDCNTMLPLCGQQESRCCTDNDITKL